MARYTKAKGRVNRRLQALIYENSGAAKALEKRSQPPGMHTRFRRPSNYGMALMEKQKIKHFYGLGERQLRRYFEKATRQKGNTGENLLLLCEQRLDNVIRKVGLAKTRPQARQGVAHVRPAAEPHARGCLPRPWSRTLAPGSSACPRWRS